jgi:putative acetyltransferase
MVGLALRPARSQCVCRYPPGIQPGASFEHSLMKRSRTRIRKIRPEEGDRVIAIWRASVEATHDFLLPSDIDKLDALVRAFLPQASLWVATDEDDRPIGFMGLSEAHMDSLFVDPAWRGVGVGRALVEHALTFYSVLTTEVNEQNMQAVAFYRRMGFFPAGRSPTDDNGFPYPLIQLRREGLPTT